MSGVQTTCMWEKLVNMLGLSTATKQSVLFQAFSIRLQLIEIVLITSHWKKNQKQGISDYSCIILFLLNSLLFPSSEIHRRSCTSINIVSTQTFLQRGKEGLGMQYIQP